MFYGVQFAEPDVGGSLSISLVHEKWLTPLKREVWGPPHKQQDVFLRSLKKGGTLNEQWCLLFKIDKTFFQEDNYQKASIKLRRAEETSDVATDIDEILPLKRARKPNRKLFTDNDSSSESENEIGIKTIKENIRDANTSVRKHKCDDKELPPKVKLIEFNLEESNTVSERFSSSNAKKTLDRTTQNLDFDHLSQIPGPSKNEDTPVRDKDFQKTILNILLKVKQQNQQILNILIEQKHDRDTHGLKLAPPTNLPVDLPLKTVTDVNRLEAYLANEKNLAALTTYCEILGGKDKVGKINTILRCLISNQVAAQYSFLGTRNQKLPFGTLNLRKVVINAVLSKFEGDTQEVDECIKVWLKHGPKRLSIENKKMKGNNYVSIVRRCELIPLEDSVGTCKQTVSKGLYLGFCEYCDYDGCNSATGLRTDILLAAIAASVLTILFH